MQKAAYGRAFPLLLGLPLHIQSLSSEKKKESDGTESEGFGCGLFTLKSTRNKVGGDGQDKSSGQGGAQKSWSVPSQLLVTWQHFPQEHVGAFQ